MADMKAKEAVNFVMVNFGFNTVYGLAKYIREEGGIPMQPIQLASYMKGKKLMGQTVSQAFYDIWGINITDTFKHPGRPSGWS